MPYGIAVYSSRLAKAIAETGVEVTVLALGAKDARAFDARQPFRTVRTPSLPVLRYALVPPAFAWLVLRNRYEAVWHTVWTSALLSWLVSPILPSPFYVSAHASEILDDTLTWRRRLKSWLKPAKIRALRGAAGLFALSRYSAECLRGMGLAGERVRVVTGGVDPGRFTPRDGAPRTGPPRLVTLARLDLHKGHDRVLEAMALLAARGRTLRYAICGEGDEHARLEEMAKRLGLTGVEFLGWQPDERLPALLRESDIFIMTSREMPGRLDLIEGLGISFLEASAAGLPVIGGRSGGVPDAVLDGRTGLLVDPDDPRAIAAAVERILDEPGLAARLGREGRRFAEEEVAWPRVARKVLDAMSHAPSHPRR